MMEKRKKGEGGAEERGQIGGPDAEKRDVQFAPHLR